MVIAYQNMYDPKLLQLLKQKLSAGNRRSIHLNALPSNLLNRLDAHHLEQLQEGLPYRFLDALLTQPRFEIVLSYRNAQKPLHNLRPDEQKNLQNTAKRLDSLVYENRDHYLEYGTEPFGFGYPLIIRRDTKQPDKLIKAPLFIWSLGIEKINSQAMSWKISRHDEMPVYVNPVLLSHIENDTGLNLSQLRNDYADDFFINQQELTDICNQLLAQLNADNEYAIPTIAPCPANDTLKNISIEKPLIRWSGVFSLYKMPKQAIIDDLDRLLAVYPIVGTSNDHLSDEITEHLSLLSLHAEAIPKPPIRFAAILTDPSQQAIVNRVGQASKQIIQGPPGTGKSQSLTALLTRALADGKRCLVVCEKRAALEVLQQNLQKIGLADWSVLIEDSDRDRHRVVDTVRKRIDESPTLTPFDPQGLAKYEQAAAQTAQMLQQQHDFLASPRLDQYGWTDLVGKYRYADDQQSKSLLDKYLFSDSLRHYQYDADTYHRLSQAVQLGKPLYEAVGTLLHTLSQINRQWYATRQSGELYQAIEQQVQQFGRQSQVLNHAAEQLIQRYTDQIKAHYADYVAHITQVCNGITTGIEQGMAQYGTRFNRLNGVQKWWTKTIALLSTTHRNLLHNRHYIATQYQQLAQYHAQHTHATTVLPWGNNPYFAHPFIAIDDNTAQAYTLEAIADNIAALRQQVAQWQTQQSDAIAQYIAQLTEQTLHPYTDIDQELSQWQQQYCQMLQHLATAQLLDTSKDISLSSKGMKGDINNLQLLMAQLSTIQASLPQFKTFYQWQRFFVTLQPDAQGLLTALATSQASDWQVAFESWYLNNWLIRIETDAVPQSEVPIKQLAKNMTLIAQQLPISAQHLWQAEQKKRVAAFNDRQTTSFNAKRLYNKRGTQERRRSTLRQIVHTDFELFTAFFPVCLVNPVVCSALFPLRRGLFDLVIFDEAGQLRIEDTFCALWRGKTQIISGDIHQMPPSDYFMSQQTLFIENTGTLQGGEPEDTDTMITSDGELADRESLLGYAEDTNFEQSYLDFHYRSQHPYLIDFSNAAFYQSRLVPMPAIAPYTPIRFEAVDGIYNDRTNEAEATAIVRYLLSPALLEQTGVNGSVGIATFNLYQRNLILDKLQAIKAEGGEAAAQITNLEANGLFVKNLENIQGDERDVMLLSTTFGTREDGKFIQNFGVLNRAKGYRLLNVIITRARRYLCVFTSIPTVYYSRYAEELKQASPSGRAYLYAYLAYAQAVWQGNDSTRTQILRQLSQANPLVDNTTDDSQSLSSDVGRASRAGGSLLVAYIAEALRQYLPPDSIKVYYTQGGITIPIALFSTHDTRPLAAIECDNAPMHHSTEAYMHDLARERCFAKMGFRTIRTYAADWWLNAEDTLRKVLRQIEEIY